MTDKSYILLACEYKEVTSKEVIVPENTLSCVVSGRFEVQIGEEIIQYEAGDIVLARKNQLLRAKKYPDENGLPFRSINVMLSQTTLAAYATQKGIPKQERYVGKTVVNLTKDAFIKAYFDSLVPYFKEEHKLTPVLSDLKIAEAIELLMADNQDFTQFLFDLNEPFKINLEKYMNENFVYNLPIQEFARLTGRSLSTFKRDFNALFLATPDKWLKEKRLQKAQYLIHEKHLKPVEVYLQVGFENYSHFSAAFKEFHGVNASQVR
jgi:AraC family transcriptional regulator, exoenzyme S synthesis regulatory protein ExsA